MVELLKDSFGPQIVHGIADAIRRAHATFDVDRFTAAALDGYEDLELTPRARQIAAVLGDFLPADRGKAIDIIVASLGPERENCDPDDVERSDDHDPMSGFFYLPHGYFVADEGGAHFDQAMRANYEITKRFTSEFSIRTPLRDQTEATLEVLAKWALDANVHVRRLVSEGTRTRLPWSFRLKNFQEDPAPVLALLEVLKDDPVEYVRRSVANNLNDLAKDHPELVVATAQRWWAGADKDRRRLIRHGLRSLVKAGDPGALAVLGFGADSPASLGPVMIEPQQASIGDKVRIEATVENPSTNSCGALVDLRVHFVKANGSSSAKVFKGAELNLGPGESGQVRKTISIAQHTTRTHYPGVHNVEIMINGVAHAAGHFEVSA